MVKIEFSYNAGDPYPYKATAKLDGGEFPGWSYDSWSEAEKFAVEAAKKWKIGKTIEIPEAKEVEI